MVDGKCSKRFPRQLVLETITGNDGYPLYRRRVKENQLEIEVDNRWVILYSPVLSKTYKAHTNVEYCYIL